MVSAMKIAHKKEQKCKQNRNGNCGKYEESGSVRKDAKVKHSPENIQI